MKMHPADYNVLLTGIASVTANNVAKIQEALYANTACTMWQIINAATDRIRQNQYQDGRYPWRDYKDDHVMTAAKKAVRDLGFTVNPIRK